MSKKNFKRKGRFEVTVKAVKPGTNQIRANSIISFDNRTWLAADSAEDDPKPDKTGNVTLLLFPDTYSFAVTYNGVTRERVVDIQSNTTIKIAAGN